MNHGQISGSESSLFDLAQTLKFADSDEAQFHKALESYLEGASPLERLDRLKVLVHELSRKPATLGCMATAIRNQIDNAETWRGLYSTLDEVLEYLGWNPSVESLTDSYRKKGIL